MIKKELGPIGIFDSGFGGLSILKTITKELPNYDYIYLGDNARAPYGNRSPEIIYEFTRQAVDFLFKNNCQLVILACNTASSDALRKIQQEYLPQYYPSKKILGVLIPGAEAAVAKTKNKKIGVMATEGTVTSGSFVREIKKLDSTIKVFQQSCPLLVPLIEAGEKNNPATKIILEQYIKTLKQKKIDTVILGCTHYGLVGEQIKKIFGDKVKVISEGKEVAKKLKIYLAKHPEIETTLTKKSKLSFYSTDTTSKFQTLGSKFFGQKIEVEKVTLN